MKKRYSAVDLTDLAIGILILGITVTIGANVLLNIRDSRLTDVDTYNTFNESTFINDTTEVLANTWGNAISYCLCNVTGTSVAGYVGAVNCTGNATISAANYAASVNAVNGLITIINTTAATYEDVWCTYSAYNESNPQWSLPNDAAIGLAEYGNWFDIIVIVGIAGLILSLIFLAFRDRGGGEGGVAY